MNHTITVGTLLMITAIFAFLSALIGVHPPWNPTGSFVNLGLILMCLAFIAREQQL